MRVSRKSDDCGWFAPFKEQVLKWNHSTRKRAVSSTPPLDVHDSSHRRQLTAPNTSSFSMRETCLVWMRELRINLEKLHTYTYVTSLHVFRVMCDVTNAYGSRTECAWSNQLVTHCQWQLNFLGNWKIGKRWRKSHRLATVACLSQVRCESAGK